MSIITQDSNNITKIIVDNIETKDDKVQLLELFEKDNFIELNIFNIQTLNKDIIIKLNEKKENISIFTNDNILKSYLLNLGFNLKFHDNYFDKQKTINIESLAIGGCINTVQKITEIIKELPKSNLSIFIIIYQNNKNNTLVKTLQEHTNHYKVVEAKSDMKAEPATIYTAPAGYHMIVAGGFIFLTNETKKNTSKSSIITSFESLSNEYKSALLSIIVCGHCYDSTNSLKLLQNNGTTIIIEDLIDCVNKNLFKNVIEKREYNQILKIKDMNEYIQNCLSSKFFNDLELKKFLQKVYSTYGYDYSGYNFAHIKRRVEIFYNTISPKDFYEFEEIVLSNKNIFKDLFLNISVNITTFYRNPEVFKILREDILSKLGNFTDIKIWCAGCSSGEEPYSIAIFLKELGLLDKSLIYATDINDVIIKNAENALYSKESYNLFLKHYYQAGGDESFSGYFNDHGDFVELNNEIKEKILFFRHNLDLDTKIDDFQLIFCRNVLIYFDTKLKNKIFDLFKNSLDNHGFLVLGESESLENHKEYKTIDKKNKIYKRQI